MKKAGAILGEGKSGFVIDPPIPCADGRNMTGYVTRIPKELYDIGPDGRKVFFEYDTSVKKAVLEKLREIDPGQLYFYYPIECAPGTLTQQNKRDGATDKNKLKSELLRKATSETWRNERYRPVTWKEWFQGERGDVFDTSAVTLRTPRQIQHLKDAVALLEKNHIVHGDLHNNNILIAADGLPRLIDFEMASIVDPEDPKHGWEFEDQRYRLNLHISKVQVKKGGKTRRRKKGSRGKRM